MRIRSTGPAGLHSLIVQIRKAAALLAVALLGVFAAPLTAHADSLGFGVSVLPSDDDATEGDIGGNTKLWFALEPGTSLSRSIEVTSASDVVQEIAPEVIGLAIVDDVVVPDPELDVAVADWVSFSPPVLELAPRTTGIVEMQVTAPSDADGSSQFFVRLLGTSPESVVESDGEVTQAIVQGALAFDVEAWVGVGAGGALVTDFEIADAVGLTVDGARTLQIEMVNTGETPIGPEGTVELQSLELTTLRAGPLTFGTAEILPGESRYAQVELPENVEPGEWRIYVVANQGNIQKTASFDKDLTFPLELPTSSPIAIWQIALIVVGILVGVLLIVIGWRLMRAPTSNQAAETVDEPVTSEMVTAPASSPGASVGVSPVSEAVDEPIVPEEAEGVADTWAQEEADRIFRELGIEDEPRG